MRPIVWRIERRHRILKDHLHAPAERLPPALVERIDGGAVEQNRAACRRDQAEQGAPERGLAGAGFTDNADGLAAADANIDAVQDRGRLRAARQQAARAPVGNHQAVGDQKIVSHRATPRG